MRAWTFQDTRQKLKLGTKAPWSVGWFDLNGKKRSKRIGSKSLAEKFSRKIEGELAAGTYQSNAQKSWASFRVEYEDKIASGMKPQTREVTLQAISHFERLANPRRMSAIKTQGIDDYVAKRRVERGRKKGDTVSPATIDKELRHLKAVLRVASEWGYLPMLPRVRMVKEPSKLPRYVTAEHFAFIYQASDTAKYPSGLPYEAGEWWRGLLTFTYMTGCRVSEPLALRPDDLDLDKATAITRHADNKGNRDELVPLHSVVVEHLRKLVSFEPVVFPWYHSRELLRTEFRRIQEAAGIHLPCSEEHEHTPACNVYGFHDLRRAFATVNAEKLTAASLQSLMRHKSYTTTQRYINMSRQLNRSVEALHVPDVLKKGTA